MVVDLYFTDWWWPLGDFRLTAQTSPNPLIKYYYSIIQLYYQMLFIKKLGPKLEIRISLILKLILTVQELANQILCYWSYLGCVGVSGCKCSNLHRHSTLGWASFAYCHGADFQYYDLCGQMLHNNSLGSSKLAHFIKASQIFSYLWT